MSDPTVLTLGGVARRYGCRVWQVRRVFERGFLPEPTRFGIYRIVHERDLPQVEAALRAAGYLSENEATVAEPVGVPA